MTASRDEAAVRAILALLRPVVDEIVLGVDEREAERILSACGDLVDQAYTYEFQTTVERYAAWLYHRCDGDWILRLDDDEVPSAALIEQLPELAGNRRHSLILLPMRDLFPTFDRYITSHPWYPDYHARMIRNVPGLWTFAGTSHRDVEVLGEHRRVAGAPLYHLHFAMPDTADRLAAARRREAATPGIMTECYPVNAVSLPELWTGVETAAVPEADRAAIARVTAPEPIRIRTPRGAERIPPEDAERLLANRTVPPDAYAAEISISPARPHLAAGSIAHLEVSIRNLGGEHWSPAHQRGPLIRPAYRWLSADGGTVIEPEGLRTPYEETVLPGEETVVMLAVRVPDEPGTYVLEVDVVHELVRWFGCAARAKITVEELDRPPRNGASRLARPDRAKIRKSDSELTGTEPGRAQTT